MTSQAPLKAFTFENATTGDEIQAWLREDSTVEYFLARAKALAFVPMKSRPEDLVLIHRAQTLPPGTKLGSVSITSSESILVVARDGEPDTPSIEALCAKGHERDNVIKALRYADCDISAAEAMLTDHNRIEKMLSATRDALMSYPAYAQSIVRDLRRKNVIRCEPEKWLEDLLLDPSMFVLEEEGARSQSQSGTSGEEDKLTQSGPEQMDPEQALLKEEADQGDMFAQYNLAVCYYHGTGIEQSYTEAARYFKLAADQGSVLGIYNYGVCLYDGNGVDQDLEQAALYFKSAADFGCIEAQVAYARCLKTGEGVQQDMAEAARYFKAAADQGNHEAESAYGQHLLFGRGIPMNPVLAAQYLLRACEGGSALALFNYGICLYSGHGTTKDVETAVKYFRMAADKGLATAQYNFGVMLYHGNGIPRNQVEGAYYVKLAADQGFPEGQALYGQLLFHGDGVPCDIPEAARYFKMSADQGVIEAQQYYHACMKMLNPGSPGPDGVMRI